MSATTIDTILDDFAFLDDWEDRYRYVIELGRALEPLPEEERAAPNKVEGCASQVWLVSRAEGDEADPVLTFRGESDAHIVQGLIAILLALYSGRRASEILALDADDIFKRLGLREHLTRQRSNGLTSMIDRIRAEARVHCADPALS